MILLSGIPHNDLYSSQSYASSPWPIALFNVLSKPSGDGCNLERIFVAPWRRCVRIHTGAGQDDKL